MSKFLEDNKQGTYCYKVPKSLLSEKITHPYANFQPRPSFCTLEIDMTEAALFRKEIEKKSGAHVSFTTLIIKSAGLGLKHCPLLSGVWQNKNIIRCSPPEKAGIVGPISINEEGSFFLIDNVNKKSIIEIANELESQLNKARSTKNMGYPWPSENGEYKPLLEITNPGAMGYLENAFTVPRPNLTSLLIINSIIKKPVVRDRKIVVRKIMNVTLSFDHYAMLAKIPMDFLKIFKKSIEVPANHLT